MLKLKELKKFYHNREKLIPIVSAAVMMIVGVATAKYGEVYALSHPHPQVVAQNGQAEETNTALPEVANFDSDIDYNALYSNVSTVPAADWKPSATDLNLAHRFPEGVDQSKPTNSYAGMLYQEIFNLDADWYSEIFNKMDMKPAKMAQVLGKPQSSVLGKYDITDKDQDPKKPETWTIKKWSKIDVSMHDGNGKALEYNSNTKEIMAMASVYGYYHGWEDYQLYVDYAKKLWEKSHSYSLSMSDVSYDKGCLTDQKVQAAIKKGNASSAIAEASAKASAAAASSAALLASQEAAQLAASENPQASIPVATPPTAASSESATTTETSPSLETDANGNLIFPKCPGHLTLSLNAQVTMLNGKKNLFKLDSIGNNKKDFNDQWKGWTEDKINEVNQLVARDWMADFGLSASSFSTGKALTDEEIQGYLNELPADLSQQRRSIIEQALHSVGKIPYYFGGKPSSSGYEGNSFYSMVQPDYKGRIFRGLDCSGWINWVYWSATGNQPSAYSTSTLVDSGRAINRSALRPGDIIVRPGGEESIGHVIIFLKWAGDGDMICIHESGNPVNNVSVGKMSAYWNYRNLLD